MKTILRERQTWKRAKPAPRETVRLSELTADEQANVLAAATKLRFHYGSWQGLADAMGVRRLAMYMACTGRKAPCAGLALRLARLAKVPVEHVLTGAFAKPGECPMCGSCEPQRNALHLVKVMGDVTLQDLRVELNLTENGFAVAGVLAGIAKNVKKAGFAFEEILQREEAGSGKNRVVSYRPGPLLVAVDQEVFLAK